MAKTSPELLADILGVLGKISSKLDVISGKPADKGHSIGIGGVMAAVQMGKSLGGGNKSATGAMATDLKALNTELTKLDIKKLDHLITSLTKYQKIEVKPQQKGPSKMGGMATAAKDAGMALLYTGAAISVFAIGFKIAEAALGMSPVQILGFIALSATVLAFSMLVISGADTLGSKFGKTMGAPKGAPNQTKGAIENAKDMGVAFMYIAGGVLALALGMAGVGVILGTGTMLAPLAILGIVVVIGMSMYILSKLVGAGGKEGEASTAVDNAKKMGEAFMYIAGGVLAMGLTLAILPMLLQTDTVLGGLLIVGGVVIGLAVMMALLGMASGLIDPGVATAKGIGVAMMILSAGVIVVAITSKILVEIYRDRDGVKQGKGEAALGIGLNALGALGLFGLFLAGAVGALWLLGTPEISIPVIAGVIASAGIAVALVVLSIGVLTVAASSKVLLEMFRSTPETGTGKKTTQGPMAAIGSALAGLGIFGLFVAGAAGMLWLMGIPLVSGPILLGSVALIAMSVSLITVAYAIRKVAEIMKTMNVKDIKANVSDMIGGVMSGVMKGVTGSLDTNNSGDLSLKELRQFRRVTKAIKLLGGISSTISDFAMGLRAFATLGEISSLEYDANGKPKIGKTGKIHVTQIAKALSETFGMFIKSLSENTEGMTRRQARTIKKLGEALTGDRGIMSAVVQFATALKTFAEFGEKNEIFIPAITDPNDPKRIIKKEEHVPVKKIVANMIQAFESFITELASKTSMFNVAGTLGAQMQQFNEALMGKKQAGIVGWFKSDKPGIMEGIMAFNEMITQYSSYGADGKIAVTDPKTGKVTPTDARYIAANMVKGIVDFFTSFNYQIKVHAKDFNDESLNTSIAVFNQTISKFKDLGGSDLSGIDKLSISIGSLADNIGKLAANMSGLNTANIDKLATSAGAFEKKYPNAGAAPSAATWGQQQQAQGAGGSDLDQLAQKIADKINASKNGTFDFIFHDTNKGKIEVVFK